MMLLDVRIGAVASIRPCRQVANFLSDPIKLKVSIPCLIMHSSLLPN